MIRIGFLAAVLTLSAHAGSWAQEAAAAPQDSETRLKQLVELLKSLSDDDYHKALNGLPEKQARRPQLASRGKVLKEAYTTLAALEYRKASLQAPVQAGARYSKAYKRLVREDPQAVAVDPETLQEAAWAGDLFKWLGSAALDYALSGGAVAVGREVGEESKTEKLERSLEGLEKGLSGGEAGAEKEADIHYKMGSVYEELAAAEPEPEAQREAKKKEQFKKMAELLQTVSDEDYQAALKEMPAQGSRRPDLVSRGGVLKSVYGTLAALEYREAARQAPQETGARYSQDLQRVSRDAAPAGAPETIQEAGWVSLGITALYGICYVINQYQQRRAQDEARRPRPRPGARSEGLRRSLDGLDRQAGGPEVSPEASAEIHHRMGALYEQMAAEAAGTGTAPEAAAPSEQPAQDNAVKSDMGELDAVRRDMQREVERGRKKSGK